MQFPVQTLSALSAVLLITVTPALFPTETGAGVVLAQTPEEQKAEAERLNQQANQLYQAGKYEEAIPLVEQILQIRRQVLGEEHPDVATSLNTLAVLYQNQGRYAEAEPLYQQALEMKKRTLGEEHPSVATSLNNLAQLYESQGRYAEAEPLHRQALEMKKRTLGEEHPSVATSLNNLAGLYYSQGRYPEAEPLYRQALEMSKRLLGEEHPDVANSLNNLAGLYSSQGRYPEAEPLYRQALEMRKRTLGEEHPSVATSLNNLAALYQNQGRYAEAEPLYRQALEMRKRTLGEEHPSVATSLNNLALLYDNQGKYAEAEPLYQQALEMRKRLLGEEHPDVAASLNNLAGLYRTQGRYAEAEPLYQQALEMLKRLLGEEHPSVATSLNSLALLYYSQGRYPEAEPLYRQALEMRKRTLGEEHPDVAISLNNLALLYYSQRRYAEAEPLYRQALEMLKRLLGEEHPDVASSLNNLAGLYSSQGRYTEAEPLYLQALEMRKRTLGEEHPDVASSLNNLAALYRSQGNATRAIDFLSQGLAVEERNLANLIAIGSEQQKRDYMNTLSGTTYQAISLHLQSAPNNSEAAKLALTTLLRRKGRILEALTDNLQTLRQNLTPANQRLLNDLNDTRSQLAALIFNPPNNLPPDQYRQQVSQLKGQANDLEARIARTSSEYRTQTQPVTLETIQKLIPTDTALVEITVYYPFDPKTDQWKNPHYAAYILKSSGDPQWVDLGETAPIDAAVETFRETLSNKEDLNNLRQAGRDLDQRLMQPIRAQLGNTRKLLLSPDGQLNLIPFAALVDENNQYLVENHHITYLTTGRDLIRLSTPADSQNPTLIVADPDYDTINPTVIASNGTRSTRTTGLDGMRFSKLQGVIEEAEALKEIFPQADILTKAEATETALKQAKSPRILHIATHGFFLTNVERVTRPTSNSFNQRNMLGSVFAPATNPENPLLMSGLVLAGFNNKDNQGDDGALTALEVAGLNLRGTKLTVLSACETGVGSVANGEGVYGLRRALAIAGSESQIISLWAVSDTSTKELMVDYYQRILGGEGRSEAMRQVQLQMLQGDKYSHPFYWSAFIPSGEWRGL